MQSLRPLMEGADDTPAGRLEELEHRERRMPFVEMDHGRVDPERLEDSHATHPQQPVLRQAHRARQTAGRRRG